MREEARQADADAVFANIFALGDCVSSHVPGSERMFGRYRVAGEEEDDDGVPERLFETALQHAFLAATNLTRIIAASHDDGGGGSEAPSPGREAKLLRWQGGSVFQSSSMPMQVVSLGSVDAICIGGEGTFRALQMIPDGSLDKRSAEEKETVPTSVPMAVSPMKQDGVPTILQHLGGPADPASPIPAGFKRGQPAPFAFGNHRALYSTVEGMPAGVDHGVIGGQRGPAGPFEEEEDEQPSGWVDRWLGGSEPLARLMDGQRRAARQRAPVVLPLPGALPLEGRPEPMALLP